MLLEEDWPAQPPIRNAETAPTAATFAASSARRFIESRLVIASSLTHATGPRLSPPRLCDDAAERALSTRQHTFDPRRALTVQCQLPLGSDYGCALAVGAG